MTAAWLRTDFESMRASGSALSRTIETARESFHSVGQALGGVDGAFHADSGAAFGAVVGYLGKKSGKFQSAVTSSITHIDTSIAGYAEAEAAFVAALHTPAQPPSQESGRSPLLDI